MGKSKTTTTNTGLDPNSQKYVDAMRQQSQAGAQTAMGGPAGGGSWFTGPQTMSIGDQAAQFFNPYMSNVVDATKQQYDQLRAGALHDTSQQATLAGAYGGSRAAVLAGSRLGQLDVGQANTIANLQNQGYQNALQQGTAYTEQQRQLAQQQMQEPLFRAQQAQQFQQGGLGPVGQTTNQTESGNWASTLGNIAQLGAGAAATYFGAKGMGGGGGGGGGLQIGGQVPMQPWQQPQFNPQYQNPYQRPNPNVPGLFR